MNTEITECTNKPNLVEKLQSLASMIVATEGYRPSCIDEAIAQLQRVSR